MTCAVTPFWAPPHVPSRPCFSPPLLDEPDRNAAPTPKQNERRSISVRVGFTVAPSDWRPEATLVFTLFAMSPQHPGPVDGRKRSEPSKIVETWQALRHNPSTIVGKIAGRPARSGDWARLMRHCRRPWTRLPVIFLRRMVATPREIHLLSGRCDDVGVCKGDRDAYAEGGEGDGEERLYVLM